MREKIIHTIGWIASLAAVFMFLSYIDQIRLNMAGHKGSVLQPAATVLNCTLWAVYGAGRAKKDWPIIIANIPGVVLGMLTMLTAL